MNRYVLVLMFSCWPQYASSADDKSLDAARALFQQRCAVAGERIYKTVKDVDGILLLKQRPDSLNVGNQFRLDDPYGSDYLGEGYIGSFLQESHELRAVVARLRGRVYKPRAQIGYAFVEADNPANGKRHRYTAVIDQPGKTDPRYVIDYARLIVISSPANGAPPRYGVTYEDISTVEDRNYWIAGSSLKILDLLTNEVIAERIGYMIDPGQGKISGGRSPWLIAADHACPAFTGPNPALPQGGQTAIFAEKVLHPRPKPNLPAAN